MIIGHASSANPPGLKRPGDHWTKIIGYRLLNTNITSQVSAPAPASLDIDHWLSAIESEDGSPSASMRTEAYPIEVPKPQLSEPVVSQQNASLQRVSARL